MVSIPRGPFPYVPVLPIPPATPIAAIDRTVARLRERAPAWLALPLGEQVRLLDEVIAATAAVAPRWIDLATRHAGLTPDGPGRTEAAIAGPYVLLRALRLHRRTLVELARAGRPRVPGRIGVRGDGRTVARVMPTDLVDRLMYLGTTADVVMTAGVTPDSLPQAMAGAYRTPPPPRVCLVLGAGNVASIAPLDVLHKLVVERQVVILKTHPVMAHLAEVHEAALRPLVDAGFVAVVNGAAAEGAHLANHPDVDTLHITGSDRTYEAIVFGDGPEGEARKARDEPVLAKPFTAELGNLTPIVVVPGRWSRAELDYQATNIATMLTNNAGFNCTASRVIVTARGWPQRAALLDAIRARLAATPVRAAYYPGAAERFAAFAAIYPQAELLGGDRVGSDRARDRGAGSAPRRLPWMLIPGLSPDASGDPAYRVEAFCSVTAETTIDAPDTATYLDRAVRFCNETLWGTLNATVIADPATARERESGAALERALAGLRYGTVSLNHWSAIGYALGSTPWGAYPGHPRTDIQSGSGFVHNPLLFDAVEQTIVRSPFRARPKPIWFDGHRTVHRFIDDLIAFEADRSPRHLLRVGALAALG